jgi:hypothetical protein
VPLLSMAIHEDSFRFNGRHIEILAGDGVGGFKINYGGSDQKSSDPAAFLDTSRTYGEAVYMLTQDFPRKFSLTLREHITSLFIASSLTLPLYCTTLHLIVLAFILHYTAYLPTVLGV